MIGRIVLAVSVAAMALLCAVMIAVLVHDGQLDDAERRRLPRLEDKEDNDD